MIKFLIILNIILTSIVFSQDTLFVTAKADYPSFTSINYKIINGQSDTAVFYDVKYIEPVGDEFYLGISSNESFNKFAVYFMVVEGVKTYLEGVEILQYQEFSELKHPPTNVKLEHQPVSNILYLE